MALSSDLMGLGISPLIAARTATGGTGPLTIVPVGASYASSTKLGATQFLVTAGGGTGFAAAASIGLPAIGSDNGAFLADDYIINNQGTGTLIVRTSTSVLISVNGSLNSLAPIVTHTSATFYPVLATLTSSTANWICVQGT